MRKGVSKAGREVLYIYMLIRDAEGMKEEASKVMYMYLSGSCLKLVARRNSVSFVFIRSFCKNKHSPTPSRLINTSMHTMYGTM